MSRSDPPRVDVSVARATLSDLIRQVNTEHIPRILTRYGTDVAVILPPGQYVATGGLDSTGATSEIVAALTEAVPEP